MTACAERSPRVGSTERAPLPSCALCQDTTWICAHTGGPAAQEGTGLVCCSSPGWCPSSNGCPVCRAIEIPQRDALKLWLAMLAGKEPAGGLLELRWKGCGQHLRRLGFFPTHDQQPIVAAIEQASRRGDIYVGVAPRRAAESGSKQSGGVDAIERVWALFVDADTQEACKALRAFTPAAAVIVRSGRGAHGYWPLARSLTPEQAKRANRRLAHHLGADMAATDAARIMRPPGTLNHKATPPLPVICDRLEAIVYPPALLVGHLPDPPSSSRAPQAGPPPASTHTPPPPAAGTARAALEGAARVVRQAQVGNRNASLNWAAYQLGHRIAAGELTEQTVRGELHAAATAAGLEDTEIDRTITSGLHAGSRA